jgi:hypothetical protein
LYDGDIGGKNKRLYDPTYKPASFGSRSAHERKSNMSARALPLPLELTKPVTLAADLDTQLRESLGLGHQYDPTTQMAMWYGGHGSRSSQECESLSGAVVIDVTVDVQIDDNDF